MSVFDLIIEHKIKASRVHEDAICVAFMDINPISPGHVLVVPRQSAVTLNELDAPTRQHLWEVAHRIGLAQQKALGSEAQHLLVNDGRAASQTVPHVHIHVIPRRRGDTRRTLSRLLWHFTTLLIPRPENLARRKKLDAQAAAIQKALEQ